MWLGQYELFLLQLAIEQVLMHGFGSFCHVTKIQLLIQWDCSYLEMHKHISVLLWHIYWLGTKHSLSKKSNFWKVWWWIFNEQKDIKLIACNICFIITTVQHSTGYSITSSGRLVH